MVRISRFPTAIPPWGPRELQAFRADFLGKLNRWFCKVEISHGLLQYLTPQSWKDRSVIFFSHGIRIQNRKIDRISPIVSKNPLVKIHFKRLKPQTTTSGKQTKRGSRHVALSRAWICSKTSNYKCKYTWAQPAKTIVLHNVSILAYFTVSITSLPFPSPGWKTAENF